MAYVNLESQLQQLIIDNMEHYHEETVRRGDIDEAYKNAIFNYPDDPRFCVIDNDGGVIDERSMSFNGPFVWNHRMLVKFYIPVTSMNDFQTVEDNLRSDYHEFLKLISDNQTMYGPRRKLLVERAGKPQPIKVADKPYLKQEYTVVVMEHLE